MSHCLILQHDAAFGPGRVVPIFRDFGIGMPHEVKRDAFALFSTIKDGGTGIGLTLVRKVIEAEHGGTVRLADNPSSGTDVIVVLPTTQRSYDP